MTNFLQPSRFSAFNKVLLPMLLAAGAIVMLAPLVVIVLTSFTPEGMSLGEAIASRSGSWDYYRAAWEQGNFGLAFLNSALVAIALVVLQVVTSTLAGYALARLRFWGRDSLLGAIVATLVIPFPLLVLPVFLVLKEVHAIDTYWALILPTAANGYGIYLMRQFFLSIPVELEEAAALDGANRAQVLWRILFPLCRPAWVTLALLTCVAEWNDLFKPLVFTTRPELRTVQLALASFQEEYTTRWGLLMAAVAIATLPTIILFAIGQRQLIQGIGSTGIKR
jgi:multiple sugar transport system permease protein